MQISDMWPGAKRPGEPIGGDSLGRNKGARTRVRRGMATRVSVLLAGAAIMATLAACTSVSLDPVASRTAADAKLQADIRRALSAYEAALKANREGRQQVEPGSEVAVRSVEPLGKVGESVVERWTIDRDGTAVPYKVTMTPVATGGTQLQVEAEQ